MAAADARTTSARTPSLQGGSDYDSDSDTEHALLKVKQEEVVLYGCKLDTNALVMHRILHYNAKQLNIKTPFGVFHASVVWFLALSMQLLILYILALDAEEREQGWQKRDFVNSIGMNVYQTAVCMLDSPTMQDSFATADCHPHLPNATTFDIVHDKCGMQIHVNHWYMYPVMIFLWLCAMFVELRDGIKQAACIYYTASTHINSEDERIFNEGNMKVVERIPRGLRIVFLVLVCLPNLFIDIAVMYIGCKFIMMQTANEVDLVVKSLCLSFVTQIDDKLVAAFTTAKTKAEFKDLKIRSSFMIKNQAGARLGAAFFFIVVFLTWVINYLVFGGLLHFRRACNEWMHPEGEATFADIFDFE